MILDCINDYLRRWSSDPDVLEGPATILGDVGTITTTLGAIWMRPPVLWSSPSTKCRLDVFESRFEDFARCWGPATRQALLEKLDHLHTQSRQRPCNLNESAFESAFAVIQRLVRFSFIRGPNGHELAMLSSDETRHATALCDEAHATFQDNKYLTERQMLWLLIWRSLKCAFAVYEETDLEDLKVEAAVERAFFGNADVARDFRPLLRSPDVANPRDVENMVAKFCLFIAKGHAGPPQRFYSLHGRRGMQEPLESHALASLRRFTETRVLETGTLTELHRAVFRLNEMCGGPVTIRRREPEAPGVVVSTDHPSPPPTHSRLSVNEGSTKKQTGQVLRTLISPSAIAPNESSQEQSAVPAEMEPTTSRVGKSRSNYSSFPHPQGTNMKSAFDYVHCPFPETRAHELAQHEQIARDMAEPGIMSEGLRPEYLVDRSPNHTADPAEFSMFTSARTLGPFGWIRSVMQGLLRSRRQTTRGAITSAHLVARRGKKEPPAKARRAVLDPSARVSKPTKKSAAPKLRGGSGTGPRPSSEPESTPNSQAVEPDDNESEDMSLNEFQRDHVQRVRQEIQNRCGPASGLGDRYVLGLLEASTYNVEEAVDAYQRSARDVSPLIFEDPESGNASTASTTRLAGYNNGQTGSGGARQPLGILQAEPEAGDAGPAPTQTGVEDEEDPLPDYESTPSPSSNQENQTPKSPDVHDHSSPVDGSCHQCPLFAGQIHHNCQCLGSDGHALGPGCHPCPEYYGEYHHQQVVQEPERAPTPLQPEPKRRRSVRFCQTPHPEDANLGREVFGKDTVFEHSLRHIRGTFIDRLSRHIHGGDISSLVTDADERSDVRTALGELRSWTGWTRQYFLDEVTVDPASVDDFPVPDTVRRDSEMPATLDLIRRAFFDVRTVNDRLIASLRHTEKDVATLSLRQGLCRFVRAVRELCRLFEEYSRRVHGEADTDRYVEGPGDDATDSEDFLSDDEAVRLFEAGFGGVEVPHTPEPPQAQAQAQQAQQAQPPSRPRTVVPTRDDYELLFKNELERELVMERGTDLPKYATRAVLIDMLMDHDRRGICGCGARNGFRLLTNDLVARTRPKKFKLEVAIQADKEQRKQDRLTRRMERANARKERRKERRGGDSTPDSTPFPAQSDFPVSGEHDISTQEESEVSEDASTSTPPTR